MTLASSFRKVLLGDVLLPWKLSIMNMLRQVYIEMAQVCMSWPLGAYFFVELINNSSKG
jgi:hypothetical protein